MYVSDASCNSKLGMSRLVKCVVLSVAATYAKAEFPSPSFQQCRNYWQISSLHADAGVTNKNLFQLVDEFTNRNSNLCDKVYQSSIDCAKIDANLGSLTYENSTQSFIARDKNNATLDYLSFGHEQDFSCYVDKTVHVKGVSEMFSVTAQNGGYCQVSVSELTKDIFVCDTDASIACEIETGKTVAVQSTTSCLGKESKVFYESDAGKPQKKDIFTVFFDDITKEVPLYLIGSGAVILCLFLSICCYARCRLNTSDKAVNVLKRDVSELKALIHEDRNQSPEDNGYEHICRVDSNIDYGNFRNLPEGQAYLEAVVVNV